MPKRPSNLAGKRSPNLAASSGRRPVRPLLERLDARIVPAVVAPALGPIVNSLAADTVGVNNAYGVAVGDLTGDRIPELVYLAGSPARGGRLYIEANGALPTDSSPAKVTPVTSGAGFRRGG